MHAGSSTQDTPPNTGMSDIDCDNVTVFPSHTAGTSSPMSADGVSGCGSDLLGHPEQGHRPSLLSKLQAMSDRQGPAKRSSAHLTVDSSNMPRILTGKLARKFPQHAKQTDEQQSENKSDPT